MQPLRLLGKRHYPEIRMALAQGHPVGQLLDISFQAIPCQEAMALGHPGGVRIVARCKKMWRVAPGQPLQPAEQSPICILVLSVMLNAQCVQSK